MTLNQELSIESFTKIWCAHYTLDKPWGTFLFNFQELKKTTTKAVALCVQFNWEISHGMWLKKTTERRNSYYAGKNAIQFKITYQLEIKGLPSITAKEMVEQPDFLKLMRR